MIVLVWLALALGGWLMAWGLGTVAFTAAGAVVLTWPLLWAVVGPAVVGFLILLGLALITGLLREGTAPK